MSKPEKSPFQFQMFIPAGTTKPRGCQWIESPWQKHIFAQFYRAKSKDDALKYFKRVLEPVGCVLVSIYLVGGQLAKPRLIPMSTEIDEA